MKKRVAVCISGQPRTWEFCIDNIKSFFKKSNKYEIDYFIHTWDSNYYPCLYKNNSNFEYKIRYNFESNVNEYINQYNPISFKIEDKTNFDKKLKRKVKKVKGFDVNIEEIPTISDYNMLSQMYSFKQSILLKKIHERKNNFKYDYVVKIRPDLLFIYKTFQECIELLENSKLPNKFVSWFPFDNLNDLDSIWGPDLFWLFDSNNLVDKYTSFFDEKIKYDFIESKEYGFNRHVYNLEMNPISFNLYKNYILIIRPFHIPFLNKNLDDVNLDGKHHHITYFFEHQNEKFFDLFKGEIEKEFNKNGFGFFDKYPRLKRDIGNLIN